jgi:hypothetical protein
MVQLDALLAQFAGVISGFDLGDGLDLQSPGFGSSSSAMSWMQRTAGGDGLASADGGGHIFSVALLGQLRAISVPARTVTAAPSGATDVCNLYSITKAQQAARGSHERPRGQPAAAARHLSRPLGSDCS